MTDPKSGFTLAKLLSVCQLLRITHNKVNDSIYFTTRSPLHSKGSIFVKYDFVFCVSTSITYWETSLVFMVA